MDLFIVLPTGHQLTKNCRQRKWRRNKVAAFEGVLCVKDNL
jgi:ribosomal protein L39E